MGMWGMELVDVVGAVAVVVVVVEVVVVVVLGIALSPSVTCSRCFKEEASCSAEIGGLLSEIDGEIGRTPRMGSLTVSEGISVAMRSRRSGMPVEFFSSCKLALS
jgi:hypothetical protein